ncbi:response regulator transcription factor [Breznakia pachnodae]|uniref:DNA-binding response OmpR family regulator n=1 Tax=Breznakia pachnodae TaxID=265178 RepID=A0ABU0DYF5_9FIRM|nr:response regulator transcription factor [Breznakia pachnodae]MDQ0359330.1 DNA-binding response OmpR family regulator [Breznakia pachnodae]
MKILIIEDNKDLSFFMKTGLKKYGFQIDTADDAEEGEEKLLINQYDVMLLDLNLPDKDGLLILDNMRTNGVDLPVIIITARKEVEDRIKGLDIGADDYMVKPFELTELNSRIHAVIRRFHGRTNPVINIGKISVHPTNRTASISGKELVLKPKEFDILEYLAQKYPAVVSSEEIAEHVYDENYDPFSSVLRVHIARLRKKVISIGGEQMFVTIRGKGYTLCGD